MRSAHLKILITGLGKKLPKTNNLDSISIICEIANAHEGSIESMYSLLRAADESDADWVKVQIYHFESLATPRNMFFASSKRFDKYFQLYQATENQTPPFCR